MLQAEVVCVVFGEVQGLGFGRNPLEGVVVKFPALAVGRHNALSGAEHLLVVEFRAVGAILAGTLNLLSEQHGF